MLKQENRIHAEKPILIGVSGCLLGENRRYDGKHKKSAPVVNTLCTRFSCKSVCPEYAIGLGVPRDRINLTRNSQLQVRAILQSNRDVTPRLQQYVKDILEELSQLSGFVLKSKSPSCGINTATLYSEAQQELGQIDGVFTATLRDYFPNLPLCEESDLHHQDNIDLFINKVIKYHRKAC